MNTNTDENLGSQFNLDDYFRAQEKTKQVVLDFSKKLRPGMSEKEARTLLEKTLDESGMQKRWHPTKMRIGPNTVRNFREDSIDYILKEDDIFFVDIGPVYYNHEGDYGETFTVGNNPRHQKLAAATKDIFYATQKVWKEKNLSGKALYAFAAEEAKKHGFMLNTGMYGHRLGDFPHAVHSKSKLGSLDFSPASNLWVLEIHLIDEELNIGAFFEDVLI